MEDRCLDFRRADCEFLKDLLWKVPCDKALQDRGTQEKQRVSKNHLFKEQEQGGGQECQEACMSNLDTISYLNSQESG